MIDPFLHKQYVMERFQEKSGGKNSKFDNYEKPDLTNFKSTNTFRERLDLKSVKELPNGHIAKDYITNRKIPSAFHGRIYFADDFKEFVDKHYPGKYNLIEDDPRIVIPFYNQQKELIALQGRAVRESKLRYITIKIEEDAPKVYGLSRWDKKKLTYVVEGPFDSMFIPNALAMGGADVSEGRISLIKECTTFIMDNEPRSKEIIRRMDDIIDRGYGIFMWPSTIPQKDINDYVLASDTKSEDLVKLINTNTYRRLEAKINLSKWKKI